MLRLVALAVAMVLGWATLELRLVHAANATFDVDGGVKRTATALRAATAKHGIDGQLWLGKLRAVGGGRDTLIHVPRDLDPARTIDLVVYMEGHGSFQDDAMDHRHAATIAVEVPPLRARGDDRAALTAHLFAQLGAQLGRRPPTFSPDAQALWDRHPWPGNVRELRNAVERLLVLHDGGVVEAEDLPPELRAHADRPEPGTLAEAIATLERERIAAELERQRGNKAATARALGISRPTLDKKLRDFGITGGNA